MLLMSFSNVTVGETKIDPIMFVYHNILGTHGVMQTLLNWQALLFSQKGIVLRGVHGEPICPPSPTD